jgi:hypothetical protein
MNFSHAVKGPLTRSGILREVDSQSEIELGRHLDPAEKTSLFSKFSPQDVLNRIQQVFNEIFNKHFPYSLHFSLVMVL